MRLPPATNESVDLTSALEQQILSCEDTPALCELLDTQAATAAPSAKLDAHLRRHLDHPVPLVTSKVLQVYRCTGCDDADILEAAAAYLRVSLYNAEWYDETITSIGWANEHLADGTVSPLTVAYADFVQEAEREGDDELLEFCRGY